MSVLRRANLSGWVIPFFGPPACWLIFLLLPFICSIVFLVYTCKRFCSFKLNYTKYNKGINGDWITRHSVSKSACAWEGHRPARYAPAVRKLLKKETDLKIFKFTLLIIFAIISSLYSQDKVEKLVVSDSTNQVYAILKYDSSATENEEGTSDEFLSDFFWHLEDFGKEYNIKINFYESSEIIFNNEKIEFQKDRSSMIIFIKKGSKEYYKIDGLASSAVLLQEAEKFYGQR